MHHPFALALMFSWFASFAMIWIAIAFRAQSYFAAGVVLWMGITAASVDWINRNRP